MTGDVMCVALAEVGRECCAAAVFWGHHREADADQRPASAGDPVPDPYTARHDRTYGAPGWDAT